MKTIRKLHFYIGMLFAPTIVFFALSGAFQILGMHEGNGASAVIAKLAQIHKDQSIAELPARKPPAHPEAAPPAQPRTPPHRSPVLIVWFLIMAVGLIASTGLGIYMAFAYKRDRVVILALLAAGTAIPIIGVFV
jgi:hypothetical protein